MSYSTSAPSHSLPCTMQCPTPPLHHHIHSHVACSVRPNLCIITFTTMYYAVSLPNTVPSHSLHVPCSVPPNLCIITFTNMYYAVSLPTSVSSHSLTCTMQCPSQPLHHHIHSMYHAVSLSTSPLYHHFTLLPLLLQWSPPPQ